MRSVDIEEARQRAPEMIQDEGFDPKDSSWASGRLTVTGSTVLEDKDHKIISTDDELGFRMVISKVITRTQVVEVRVDKNDTIKINPVN